jgi:glyoxylase-like metal-dependent hydrolase (beta-lactamase superfamily II)
MCPLGGAAVWGTPSHFIARVLLVETARDGLVLVDTGISLADRADPHGRLGALARVTAIDTADAGAAIEQVKALGYDPNDVRHIALTHFDFDHAGGIADFPWATVHLLSTELDAVRQPRGIEKRRYRTAHVEALRGVETYPLSGERWRGFDAAQQLRGVSDEIALVPLIGHTRGHAAIAVATDEGHILHAGDAYMRRSQVDGGPTPLAIRLFERAVAWDYPRVLANHERLAAATRDPSLTLVASHDPSESPPCRIP